MSTILANQDRAFFDLINPQYVSWEFYSQYLDKEPPFGELGAVIYLRTYSRFVNELKRRETWQETVLRNIEYSLSLDTVSCLKNKQKEAEELFEMMFHLQGFPAGRSLWTAGTLQTKKDSSSNWNCTFKTVDSLSAFSEIFYWLLIGAGTGFSVQKEYISQLPKLNPKVHIIHENYNYQKRIEGTFINLADTENTPQFSTTFTDFVQTSDIVKSDADFANSLNGKYKIARIQVGDSKEDWCNSLRIFLKILANESVEKIYINYDPIRPEGTLIKTFGGRASGYKALLSMFDNIIKIVKRCEGNLDSLAVLDIINSIGLNVVSGGVRRTAQLALGDSFDDNFKTAKVGLFTDPSKEEYQTIRTMSNNSTGEYGNPGLEAINKTFECLRDQGDPGFWIIGNSQKLATSPVKGTNPCAEASLDDRQSCNLTTGNVKSCVYWDEETHTYMFDWEKWFKVICLVTRLGCRITLASQWHPEWDKIQKRDRLLGVSMTGVMDAFDLLGWDEQQQKCFFSSTKSMAVTTADEYHNFLGINRSARICLMKPEGTISLLPTVSSGIHRAYAPYYLRRVRFSKFDPLAKVLLDLGLRPVPENGQGDDLFGEKCTTWVFTFPIKSNAKIRAIDETVVDQLERYKLAQTYYADRGHNISCTITVARHEYDTAAKWVNDNWDSIIGVAFLPRFDPMEGSKASYPLMPLEPCDQETYEKLKAALPTFSQLKIIQKLSEIEKGFEEQELEKGCFTGACPVR
ncbi:MAG: hypothetical protein ACKPE3_01185 [Sphaerospermopsis kisseleviana]